MAAVNSEGSKSRRRAAKLAKRRERAVQRPHLYSYLPLCCCDNIYLQSSDCLPSEQHFEHVNRVGTHWVLGAGAKGSEEGAAGPRDGAV